MTNDRTTIEAGIISAVIDANGFAVVANYLTENNFKHEPLRQVYMAAKSLYPNAPIDRLSLMIEVKKLFDGQYDKALDFIFNSYRSVYFTSSVPYWCLILIQMDIANEFGYQLSLWKDARELDGDHVEAAVLKEIYETISPYVDILLLVEKSIEYFKFMAMDPEYQKSLDFNKNVVERAMNIKNTIAIESALKALYTNTKATTEIQIYCSKFADAISDMIISQRVKDKYIQAAELIN